MEEMYTDKQLLPEPLKELLKELFPSLKILYWNSSSNVNEDLDTAENIILFNTEFDSKKIEFGCKISIYRTPDENSQQRALYIGKNLSIKLQTRTLVPFMHPEKINDPYYDIVFENGRAFLVDDSNTNLLDGTDGLVRTLEEYELPDYQFDGFSKIIT